MLDLTSALPYGRDFRESAQQQWWYSRADEQIIHVERLRAEYGFQSDAALYDCTFLVPLWRTDVLRKERAFLRIQPRSPMVRRVEAQPDAMLDRAFRVYVEQARLMHDWREWEQKALRRDGEKWCRENGIPFK